MATVVLTQPALRAAPLARALRGLGHEALEWPMSAIEPAPELDAAALAARLAACRWALFPSPGAIDLVMGALQDAGAAWPSRTGIGVVGPGSRAALDAWVGRLPGLETAATIEPARAPYDAHALLERPELAALAGVPVAVLRRDDGRREWLDALRARGAALDPVTVYASRRLAPPEEAAGWLAGRAAAGRSFAVSVASADAGARLAALVRGLPDAGWLLGRPVLTQHPRIAEALARHGWRRTVLHEPGRGGLVGALESAADEPT